MAAPAVHYRGQLPWPVLGAVLDAFGKHSQVPCKVEVHLCLPPPSPAWIMAKLPDRSLIPQLCLPVNPHRTPSTHISPTYEHKKTNPVLPSE